MIEINNHLLVIISSVLSLYIFNFLEQSSTSYHCWTKSGLLPLLVKKKKVLLETVMPTFLCVICGFFCALI